MAGRPAYDLIVLIDGDAPEERRGQILDGIRNQIAAGDGDLASDVDWGVRKLAFEIAHRGDAYYHLFQLESSPELLQQLEHSLSIDDAVLRHRIVRLPKGPSENPARPGPSAPPRPARTVEGDESAASTRPDAAAAAPTPETLEAPETPKPTEGAAALPQEESRPAT